MKLENYYKFYNFTKKARYPGVAMFTKEIAEKVSQRMDFGNKFCNQSGRTRVEKN